MSESYSKLIGSKFGLLTVIDQSNDLFQCECECGNICYKSKRYLTYEGEELRNCGCLDKLHDKVGKRYGEVVVLSLDPMNSDSGGRRWTCLCNCGRITSINSANLRDGFSISCGRCNIKRGVYKPTESTNELEEFYTACRINFDEILGE